MQRSSETIGAIAAALAKAQIELTNPEKSLTGRLASESPREDGKTFRYAPLSSGLEIVRKCLGKHEIAAVQTTTIDKEGGLIRLTTTLAHASGEWLSSEWPICPASETSAPHRLGAALTYARRHSLFTLVGIAGDDDTDAPGVLTGAKSPQDRTISIPKAGPPLARRALHSIAPLSRSTLSEEESRVLRDKLLAEIGGLTTLDELTVWAKRTMSSKNALLEADARSLEAAFTDKAVTFGTEALDDPGHRCEADGQSPPPETGRPRKRPRSGNGANEGIDKSVLAFPEPRRVRDKDHLKFVGAQPCLICGRSPSDAHHVRFAQLRALGRKASDEFTVPVCRTHHRELHTRGDEKAWWTEKNLDPLQAAETLWRRSHPLPRDTAS